jgi:Na+/H+-dicarboxylate symporter
MKKGLTFWIVIALVIGILSGFLLNIYFPEQQVVSDREILDQLSQRVLISDSQQHSVQPLLEQVLKNQKLSEKEKILEVQRLVQEYQPVKFEEGIKQIVSQESTMTDQTLSNILDILGIFTEVFLRLIKMIIAPLVLATLVAGVAKLGDIKAVGRIGGKTLLWFFTASLISLTLGAILVNAFEPGKLITLTKPAEWVNAGIETSSFSIKGFIGHIFPTSIVEALAKNEILQIVVFSIFFGVGAAAMGEKASSVIKALDTIGHIMLKITTYIMYLAPFAVFSAITSIVAKKGIGVLSTYVWFMSEFYLGLVLLWFILFIIGWMLLKSKVKRLFSMIKEPLLLAFSTASSEAAYPKLIEQLERFGCRNRIVSFVLPLGYSFNLDGSMMYMTFASLFIAQAYGVDLSLSDQVVMLLTLMITSKGIAGVPRASLVVIAGTISSFGIPEAGLMLLLGVDHILDMGRSATNVVGNAIASVAIEKWES